MDQNEWRGVFFALLEETKGGSDDAIIAIAQRRFANFGFGAEQHFRSNSARWREEDKQFGTLYTDGSIRHWSSGD